MHYVSVETIESIIANTQTSRPYAEVYEYILSTMSSNGQPLSGADIQAWQWFKGAADVNRGQGTFSNFIRDYTNEQVLIRNGDRLTSAQLDAASDSIAIDLVANIIANNGRIPTIREIGQYDITNTANSIFGGNEAGWSGNPLFVMLGDSSFFNNNIIESDGDTYDALAMLRSSASALGATLTGATAFYDIGMKMKDLLIGPASTTSVSDLVTVSENLFSFFSRSYGDSFQLIPNIIEMSITGNIELGREGISESIFLANPSGIANAGDLDDYISVTSFRGLIDGSSGFDTINYVASNSLKLDIGNATQNDGAAATANFIGTISNGVVAAGPAANITYIFNTENIILSTFDDIVHVRSISSENANTTINGAGGSNAIINDSKIGAVFNIDNETFTLDNLTIHTKNFSSYTGGSGDDTFIGAINTVMIDGGDGIDTISFELSTSSVDILPTELVATGIERIVGSSFDDIFDLRTNTLTSWISDENVEIDGGSGNDILDGTEVSNRLSGGLGDDVIHGWAGNDTIVGGDGDDLLIGGEDNYYLASDDDIITGGAGNDYIDGGAGDDHLFGGDGSDVLIGGAGNDFLEGGDETDFLFGGDGNDTLVIANGSQFSGGIGDDTFVPVGTMSPDDNGIIFSWAVGQGSDTLKSIDPNILSSGNTNYGFDRVLLSGVSLSDISINWFPKFMHNDTWVRDVGYSSPNIMTTVTNYYMGNLEILISSTGEKITIEGQWGSGGYSSDTRGYYAEQSPVSFDFIYLDNQPVIVDGSAKNVEYNVHIQESETNAEAFAAGGNYTDTMGVFYDYSTPPYHIADSYVADASAINYENCFFNYGLTYNPTEFFMV